MRKPKPHILIALAGVSAILLFTWYVWPTVWVYGDSEVGPYRINRFTASRQFATANGWENPDTIIEEASRAANLDARRASENEESMRLLPQAEEVAVAIRASMGAYGDTLPKKSNWDTEVQKYAAYTQNGTSVDLHGFVYVRDGERASSIGSPDKVEVGYIEGDFGRATAFLDGHASWAPKANP